MWKRERPKSRDLSYSLKDKDKIIAIMNQRIKEKQNQGPVYQQAKGDVLDQMLFGYIQQANCPVPIRKLGSGFYLFGTKKIYAKILNGKLVIRVGGGYMIIEEFIKTYADSEMKKIAKLTDEQLAALAGDSKPMTDIEVDQKRLTMVRQSSAGAMGSPKAANARKSLKR